MRKGNICHSFIKIIIGLVLIILIHTIYWNIFNNGLYNWNDFEPFTKSMSGKINNYDISKVVVIHDLSKDNYAMGLTNQLARIVQLIEYGCRYNVYVNEKSFRLDFANKYYGSLEDVIDIDKTNQNFNCTRIIKSSELQYFRSIKNIKGDKLDKRVGDGITILLGLNTTNYYHKLEFSQSPNTTWISSEGILTPLKYYAMHFRIEMDLLMIYFNNQNTSDFYHWLRANRKDKRNEAIKFENRMIKNDANSTLILCFIQKYVNLVKEHFTDKSLPIILATSLGKKDVTNQKIEWILGYFRYRMTALGYTTLVGKATSRYRELNAVADTKMIRGAEECITFGGSTFSVMANIFRTSKMINRSPCTLLHDFKECGK